MVGFLSISPFTHPLEFDTIHVVDQGTVDFRMIPNTNLSTHYSFIWPCTTMSNPIVMNMSKRRYVFLVSAYVFDPLASNFLLKS